MSWLSGRKAASKRDAKPTTDSVEHDVSTSTPGRRRPLDSAASMRSRPSSMISITFPSAPAASADTSFVGGGVGDSPFDASFPPDRSPRSVSKIDLGTSSAQRLLSSTQQRDQRARRERTSSTASSMSSVYSCDTDGKEGASHDDDPMGTIKQRPRKRTIKTSLPSLIRGSAMRPHASSSSSDRPSLAALIDASPSRSAPLIEPLSEASSPTSRTPLTSVTNIGSHRGAAADQSTAMPVKVKKSRSLFSKKSKAARSAPQDAMESLLRLQGGKVREQSVTAPKSPSSPSGAHAVIESSTGDVDAPASPSQGEAATPVETDTVQFAYPYRVRRSKTGRQLTGPFLDPKQASRSTDSVSQARYALTWSTGRSGSFRFSHHDVGKGNWQIGLFSFSIPRLFGGSYLVAWLVERGARVASSVLYLLGS